MQELTRDVCAREFQVGSHTFISPSLVVSCAGLFLFWRFSRSKPRRRKNAHWLFGAPAGIRTPNQQIMRRFEEHQQGETN